jgi:hypothetical protein
MAADDSSSCEFIAEDVQPAVVVFKATAAADA